MHPTTSVLLDPFVVLRHLDVREGMSVAELGSGGHGHFVFPLAKMVGTKGTVWAIDIRPSALSSIESRARFDNARNVKTLRANLESKKSPFQESSLDRATFIGTLSQAENCLSMLKFAHAALKPSSILLVVEWHPTYTALGPTMEKRLAPDDLLRYANQAGFGLRNEFSPGSHHYGYTFVAV